MVVFSLTLVRHGETSFNRKCIIQGQRDIPLSQIGMQQARLVGSRLQNERFTHIFASDLARASQTAQAIVDANKVCRSQIVHDKRLRERKFGNLEGKSSKELLICAKKANLSLLHFTPEGGESVEQLKERSDLFFSDLCEILLNFVAEDVEYIPASVKRPHGGSLGRNSAQAKAYILSRRSQSFCGLSSVAAANGENDIDSEDIYVDNKRFRFDPDDEEDGISVVSESSQEGMLVQGPDIPVSDFVTEVTGDKDFEDSVDSVIARSSSSSSSGYSSLPDGGDSSETSTPTDTDFKMDSPNIYKHEDSFPGFFYQAHDGEKQKSHTTNSADTTYHGCPNVSLSPLMEQRLPSISSISSGRNNSFEEVDAFPPNMAEVLVVSHGGVLKELVRHFVENLQCKIPGGKSHALRLCPNTGISKFMVTVDDATKKPLVSCLAIHDKDHLFGMSTAESEMAV